VDVETVIHSDSGFAAVSYLKVKEATLEEKPESGRNLTVPPLLDANFALMQALLRGNHSVDSPTYAISKPVTHQPQVQSRGSSGSRRGGWVAIGNVFCATGQDITFEEEVIQCFCDLRGSSTFVEDILF